MAGEMMAILVGPGDGFSDDDHKALAALAGRSDDTSIAKVRDILGRYPDALARVGNMARQLERNTICDIAGGDDNLASDALAARCTELRRSFGYRDAAPVERLLVDRIVATWLHLQRAESARRRAWTDSAILAKRAYYDAAVSRAQSDHHRAIVALAKVRRLGLPTLQVNIAEAGAQQLNVSNQSVGS